MHLACAAYCWLKVTSSLCGKYEGRVKRCQAEVEFLSLFSDLNLFLLRHRSEKDPTRDACDVIMLLRLLLAVAFFTCSTLAQNDGWVFSYMPFDWSLITKILWVFSGRIRLWPPKFCDRVWIITCPSVYTVGLHWPIWWWPLKDNRTAEGKSATPKVPLLNPIPLKSSSSRYYSKS